MRKIEFSSCGKKLIGNVSYPKKLKELNPVILFIHGWTSQQNRHFYYMEELSKLEFICMSFDMRGHGVSEGELKYLSRADFLNDVIAACDYLLRVKNVDRSKINVVGSSFGSYLGSVLTSKRKVKSLVLRVPADYTNTGFDKPQLKQARDEDTFSWRSTSHKPRESLALKSVSEFDGDVLIVESGKDELVDHQTIKNYLDAVKDKNKLTYIVMKDAPHSINHNEKFKEKFKEILISWFNKK